ncbi:MAG TPA: relaxase/mobilization nuclease domain-containing protein [Polaromonas sp.]|uniref:relaxase/mobilization nuclease domain-containing protein n=1 Tax=Polaromonas sp. TaxID=1869339 RepID=UPI002D3552FB|nr:relaxase/mobilization nuclease domain-containing protein [Polaromonas sp.]HYW57452.1 relaxase/mobilization nuclease domain-containing protein [Polaromonas sp.]
MIGKIAAKGRSFRGLSAYLLRRGRGRIVAGVMAGRTPRELSKEFGVLRRLNPKLTKAVAHLMLSPAPDDPPLTDQQWEAIAQHYIGAMGFSNAPWVAVVHQDTDHQHMHLMACRIGFDGKTISDANDFRKSEAVVRQIEAQFGLAAVPSPDGFKPKPSRRAKANQQEATTQGDKPMTNSATPPNPFDPANPQDATRPESFEPGRDQAELALVNSSPGIVASGASVAEPLTKKQAQAMRRAIVEDDYQERMQTLLGDDLTRVHRHPQGATLYFKQKGRIADQGSKLTVLGGMDQRLAAQRIVAMGIDRGWKSITFTGSGSFIELAMREALRQQLPIVASDDRQQIILDKLMAERRGGMGTMVLPVGAVPADEDIPAILAELDDLNDLPALPGPMPSQPAKSTAPVAPPPAAPADPRPPEPPKPAQVGVLPKFLNLSERLHDRRAQKTSNAPGTTAPPAKRPGGPGP